MLLKVTAKHAGLQRTYYNISQIACRRRLVRLRLRTALGMQQTLARDGMEDLRRTKAAYHTLGNPSYSIGWFFVILEAHRMVRIGQILCAYGSLTRSDVWRIILAS